MKQLAKEVTSMVTALPEALSSLEFEINNVATQQTDRRDAQK